MISSNVRVLHPTSPPLAGYLRVGHTGHQKLEALHAADRLGFNRLVFDAAYAVGQAEFVRARPPNGKGGGTSRRAYVPDLDRYLTEEQLQAFFAVRGTKSRFACADSSCCTDRHEDMLDNGHAHFITQRSRQLEELSKLHPLRRAESFLLRQLDPAVRSTRQASKLKFGDEGVQKLVGHAKSRLTRLRDALGALHEADGATSPTSAAPVFRGSRQGSGGMSVIQGGRP